MGKVSMIFRILLTLLIFNGFLFYLGWNVSVYFSTLMPWYTPMVFWLVFFLLSYSYLIGRFTSSLSFLRNIGSLMFGFFQYAFVLFPFANGSVWLARLAGVSQSESILWTGHVTTILLFILFTWGLYNAYSPVVREYKISIPKIVEGKESLRITMASDMHFGRLSGVSHAKRLIREVNQTSPDLILLAGDVIDDELDPFTDKKMGEILSNLHAPLGVFGVLGNHEYYGGQIQEYREEMKRVGIPILTDESLLLDNRFYLLGRKDKTDRNRMSYQDLTASLNREYPIISMDHQPSELQEACDAFVDISFSGHTHRGQMAPNHLITKRLFELDWGYVKKAQLHAFVSSGYGFWGPPLRIGSRSEIVQVDVTFSENQS
ncbi:metallophosphoesterase [Bacillus sp. 2205SS5-2]|uniref:metallophosphoesterase n=1 Tax=Bacillus sp. 2205SS5-2 TaxID=3109031 RepID=UPI0030053F2F